MGPVSVEPESLYIVGEDGVYTPWTGLTDVTVVHEDNNTIGNCFGYDPGCEFSMMVNPRRMSKKRFIKKLMGIGWPRNASNAWAIIVADEKYNYALAYSQIMLATVAGGGDITIGQYTIRLGYM